LAWLSCTGGLPEEVEKLDSFLPGKPLGDTRKDHTGEITYNTQDFRFLLFNPRSMCNKVHQLMEALVDNSVDFAGICETWLTEASSPITAVIKSFGFSILHNFRKEKKGGGTALIYKSCFKLSVVRSKVHTKSFEYTAATIKTGNVKSNVMFIILYRPGQMCSQFNQELDALLADLTPRCDCLVLAGDLNIHFDHSANKLYKQSHDVLLSYGMKKLISEATHIGGGSLDQVFTLSQDNQLECVVKIDNI
jgi:hypothetical protein